MYHNYRVMFEDLLSVGGLSLDRLKNFCAVAEAGGIARVTDGDPARQSLYSRQIRELEQFFGVELTRRHGKGIELTEAGRELSRQARLAFTGLSDFKAGAAGMSADIRIGSGNSVLEWMLIPKLRAIRETTKGARFTFQLFDFRTADTIRGLLEHTLDFGIVRSGAVIAPLKFHSLGEIGYQLFIPKRLQKKITASDAAQCELAISTGGEFAAKLEASARKARIPLQIAYRCTSLTQAARLVQEQTCCAILPEIAAEFLGDTASATELPWLKSYRRNLGIAWHPRLLEARPQIAPLFNSLKQFLN